MARIGKAAAVQGLDTGAVAEVAALGEHNAERGLHRLVHRWGMKLKVPISYAAVTDGTAHLKVPYLKISDYLKCLLMTFPTCLFGGCGLESAQRKCAVFWKGLYQSQPTHEVFCKFTPEDMESCCVLPITLHGDEGTGSKKQPIAIGCFETVFGLEDSAERQNKRAKFDDCSHPCCLKHKPKGDCCKRPGHWPYPCLPGWDLDDNDFEELMSQWPTTKGHSFLSRYLTYVIPTSWLDKGPWVLDGVQKEVAEDLRGLLYNGFSFAGKRFHVAVVSLKGDAKWHARVGQFKRSYHRLGDVRNYEICPDCRAGHDNYPFEQSGDDPLWVRTFGASVPWDSPGAMESIPFDSKFPSFKFKRDILHTFKLGLGRDICGSCILMLCKVFCFFDCAGDSLAVKARLARAHSRFVLYCSATCKTAHVRSFTLDFLHYKSSKAFPFTASKGSDTVLILQWLSVELKLALRENRDCPQADMLRGAIQTCEASCKMLELLYNHGLWLPRKCMSVLRDMIIRVVRGYSFLSCSTAEIGFPAFRYKSTFHSMHHFGVELDIALQSPCRCYPNPLLNDCSQPEDFIGRTARTARSTHGRTTAVRTLQRHLVKTKMLMKRSLQGT